MIRSKTRLEIIVGIKLITLDLVLTGSHVRCAGSETARSYGSDEPSEAKIIKVGHLPGRHLFTEPNEIQGLLQ